MSNKDQKTISIRKNVELSQNEVKDILIHYFSAHSSRRFNFIYWNVIDTKYPKLIFVNLIGNKLIKINNGDLRFRIVNVLNRKHWDVIKWFINTFLIDSNNDKRAINVIRVDYILAYLKKIKYDFDKILFSTNGFGSIMIMDKDKSKVISYVDRDIQSVYLVESLINNFNQFEDIDMISDNEIVIDNLEDYLNGKEYKIKIPGSNIYVTQVDGLDYPSNSFVKKCKNSSLKAIIINDNLSTKILTLFKSEGDYRVSIITSRVYISYYLGKRMNKHKKKAKGVDIG